MLNIEDKPSPQLTSKTPLDPVASVISNPTIAHPSEIVKTGEAKIAAMESGVKKAAAYLTLHGVSEIGEYERQGESRCNAQRGIV